VRWLATALKAAASCRSPKLRGDQSPKAVIKASLSQKY
jgi:hypothetical protein